MGERVGFAAPGAAVVGMVGLCCGLPVLLSLGVLGAAAGVSAQSWALVAAGLVVAMAGWVRWSRRRAGEPADATSDTTCEKTSRDSSEAAPR
jgi:hypothetical protein